MPAFNAAPFLADSVGSVQAQTFENWELFVVDDGSGDETRAVAHHLAQNDARIKVLHQPNGGQGAARNAGLRHAVGEWVAFLDADDLWKPQKLERQWEMLQNIEADIFFCDGWIFEGAKPTEEQTFGTLTGIFEGPTFFELLLEKNRIPILTALVKRTWLEKGFEASRAFQNCEDYDLWLRLAREGARFYGMPEKLAFYRRHPSAMTYGTSLQALQAEIAVLERHAPAIDDVVPLGSRATISGEVQRHLARFYHGVALALIDRKQWGAARRWLWRVEARRVAGPIAPLQRFFIALCPVLYRKTYAGLSVLRQHWGRRCQ